MARTKIPQKPVLEIIPMLKTVEQMSLYSGIGTNKLRDLIKSREIEFIQIGNRFLLSDQAIWDWYRRNRICPANENREVI